MDTKNSNQDIDYNNLLAQEFLTAAEIAKRHNISRSAIVKKINAGDFYLQDGRVAAYRIGRHWRVLREALNHYERSTIEIAPTRSGRPASESAAFGSTGPNTNSTAIKFSSSEIINCPTCGSPTRNETERGVISLNSNAVWTLLDDAQKASVATTAEDTQDEVAEIPDQKGKEV